MLGPGAGIERDPLRAGAEHLHGVAVGELERRADPHPLRAEPVDVRLQVVDAVDQYGRLAVEVLGQQEAGAVQCARSAATSRLGR